MAWPRLAAIAEAVWSPRQAPAGAASSTSGSGCEGGHLERLDHLDVAYRPLDGPHNHRTG